MLVATDIAARGLDIDQLPQVVNFELPNVPEDYVHRIGRTGRAGASGAAVSLVDHEEAKLLKDIERLIKREIPKIAAEGFVPPTKVEPEAPRPPRPQQRRPQGGQPGQARNANAGNRNQPPRNGQNRGNQPRQPQKAKPQQEQPQKPMSEAARHQAMVQTPIFAPKPIHRGQRHK